MFTHHDTEYMLARGISPETAMRQIENYKSGFPFVDLIAPATPGHGIQQVEEQTAEELASRYHSALKGRDILKFVPASGAASRMFKSLFEFRDHIKNKSDDTALFADRSFNSAYNFLMNIRHFAFHNDLEKGLEADGKELTKLLENKDYSAVFDYFLGESGLNYANLPKGLLKFHLYRDEAPRTALEEHLAEAAHYASNDRNHASVHFTVSPEHMKGFKNLVESVKHQYEERFGVKFNIEFSIQKPSTDTIAVDLNNEPFREKDGSLLFRPGGHGALIENLNDLNADIVFIKNIDNTVPDRLKAATYLYKKVIGTMLAELQGEIFHMLVTLDQTELHETRLIEMAVYCNEKIGIRMPDNFTSLGLKEKTKMLHNSLNRPIRICGMVKNEGEPGGGPFWVKDRSGNTSLQIVETSQINLKDEGQARILQASTHFNPVDLVCGLKNYKGENFNLPDFVDPSTGFIAEKSKDGRQLKAQELPGLWNGAMAGWITLFVEVPVITFNPVKTINDLLRKEHLID
jgi:hypothetical protein